MIKPRLPVINRGHSEAIGLLNAYTFHEGGGTELANIHNKKDNGTLTNFADLSVAWGDEQLGKTLFFNSSNSEKVALGDLKWSSELFSTISIWTKVTSLNGQTLFSEGNTGDVNPLYIIEQTAAEKVSFTQRSGVPILTLTSSTNIFNAWHMITITRENDLFKLYVDGVLEASGTKTISAVNTNVSNIGVLQRTSSVQFLNGHVAELRLYSRTFAASEVSRMYSNSWGLYVSKKFAITKLISQRITQILQELKYTGLDLKNGVFQTISPDGHYLRIELVSEVPSNAPAPGGNGIVFFINPSNQLDIYGWDGTSWRKNSG